MKLPRLPRLKFKASWVQDLAAGSGAGVLSYGVAEIYRPAGFIVLGLLLIVAAFLSARAPR